MVGGRWKSTQQLCSLGSWKTFSYTSRLVTSLEVQPTKKKKSKRIELKKPKIRFYEITVNNVVLSPTSPLATASIQQWVGKAGSRCNTTYFFPLSLFLCRSFPPRNKEEKNKITTFLQHSRLRWRSLRGCIRKVKGNVTRSLSAGISGWDLSLCHHLFGLSEPHLTNLISLNLQSPIPRFKHPLHGLVKSYYILESLFH